MRYCHDTTGRALTAKVRDAFAKVAGRGHAGLIYTCTGARPGCLRAAEIRGCGREGRGGPAKYWRASSRSTSARARREHNDPVNTSTIMGVCRGDVWQRASCIRRTTRFFCGRGPLPGPDGKRSRLPKSIYRRFERARAQAAESSRRRAAALTERLRVNCGWI